MTEKGHRKISGGEWENFRWRNIVGGECLEKVIGNLACREMLYYKKALCVCMCTYTCIAYICAYAAWFDNLALILISVMHNILSWCTGRIIQMSVLVPRSFSLMYGTEVVMGTPHTRKWVFTMNDWIPQRSSFETMNKRLHNWKDREW